MNTLTQLIWIEASKKGSYLVSVTPSAAKNIDEHLLKRAKFLSDDHEPLVEEIFGNLHVTPGIIAYHFAQCKKLCLSFVKEFPQDTLKALKEFTFCLRNILLYSDYKDLIKELEKASTPLKDFTHYIQYIEQKENISPNSYLFKKYQLLYSFIREIRETSRFQLRQEKMRGSQMPIDQEYQEFLTVDNQLAEILPSLTNLQQQSTSHWHAFAETHFQQTLQEQQCTVSQLIAAIYGRHLLGKEIEKISAINPATVYEELLGTEGFEFPGSLLFESLSFQLETEPSIADFLKAANVQLEEVFTQTVLSTEDLEVVLINQFMRLDEAEAKQWLEAVTPEITIALIQTVRTSLMIIAITRYFGYSTDRLAELIVRSSPKAQPVKEIKAPAKSTINEQQLRKEISSLQMTVQSQEELIATLQAQLDAAQKQLAETNTMLFNAQTEREELQQLLEIAETPPPIPPAAKHLVGDLQALLQKLQEELDVVPEQEEVMIDDSYLEKVKDLKLAVIGGHQKYHSQIKQKFKQAVVTISPDKLNFTTNQLANFDVIVITTGYMNHSLYERTFDHLKKLNMKEHALIINTQPNPERLAKQIFDFLN